MTYINKIQEIAELLDQEGLYRQADLLDKHLFSYAQAEDPMAGLDMGGDEGGGGGDMAGEVPEAPTAEATPNRDQKEQIARTTFYKLDELRDFYVKHLPGFAYYGDDNLKTLQASFDELVTMFRVILRNMSKEYNRETVSVYGEHLKKLEIQVNRSKNLKLTPVKVIVDKMLLYGELDLFVKKIERHYDSGLTELEPVVRKMRAVRNTFSNIIQNTSEEIVGLDLIETS